MLSRSELRRRLRQGIDDHRPPSLATVTALLDHPLADAADLAEVAEALPTIGLERWPPIEVQGSPWWPLVARTLDHPALTPRVAHLVADLLPEIVVTDPRLYLAVARRAERWRDPVLARAMLRLPLEQVDRNPSLATGVVRSTRWDPALWSEGVAALAGGGWGVVEILAETPPALLRAHGPGGLRALLAAARPAELQRVAWTIPGHGLALVRPERHRLLPGSAATLGHLLLDGTRAAPTAVDRPVLAWLLAASAAGLRERLQRAVGSGRLRPVDLPPFLDSLPDGAVG